MNFIQKLVRLIYRRTELHMSATLSFSPKFHHEINVDGLSGWVLSASLPPGAIFKLWSEIAEEQQKIKLEGGSIMVVDPKRR